jgi:hypothetical protein
MDDFEDILDDADWEISEGFDKVKQAFDVNPRAKGRCIETLEQWVRLFNRELAFLTGKRERNGA